MPIIMRRTFAAKCRSGAIRIPREGRASRTVRCLEHATADAGPARSSARRRFTRRSGWPDDRSRSSRVTSSESFIHAQASGRRTASPCNGFGRSSCGCASDTDRSGRWQRCWEFRRPRSEATSTTQSGSAFRLPPRGGSRVWCSHTESQEARSAPGRKNRTTFGQQLVIGEEAIRTL